MGLGRVAIETLASLLGHACHIRLWRRRGLSCLWLHNDVLPSQTQEGSADGHGLYDTVCSYPWPVELSLPVVPVAVNVSFSSHSSIAAREVRGYCDCCDSSCQLIDIERAVSCIRTQSGPHLALPPSVRPNNIASRPYFLDSSTYGRTQHSEGTIMVLLIGLPRDSDPKHRKP